MKNTLLLLLAVIAVSARTTAATYTISTANFQFTPAAITNVHIGDTVKWVWANGSHTTTSTSVPAGVASWNAQLNSGSTTFIYIPTVLGTYNYECTPHAPNMAGSFTVTSGSGTGTTLPPGIVRNIKVEDYEFKPTSLTVNLGDTIRWFHDDGSHTTTSVTIPAGAAPWDAPINSSTPTFRYVPTKPGTYNYKCTPHASMGMTGSFTVVATVTGVTHVAGEQSFALYPNPAGQVLHLDLTAFSGPVQLTITDIAGRRLESRQADGGKAINMPVEHLPDGTYILQTSGQTFSITQRFIVSH